MLTSILGNCFKYYFFNQKGDTLLKTVAVLRCIDLHIQYTVCLDTKWEK